MVQDLQPILDAAFNRDLADGWAVYTEWSVDTMCMNITRVEQWDTGKHLGKTYILFVTARDELEAFTTARKQIGAD
jgi:hypothetical protein